MGMTWDHLIDGVDPCDNEERIGMREKMRQNSIHSLLEQERPTKEKFVKGHRRTTSAAPRIEYLERTPRRGTDFLIQRNNKITTAQDTEDLEGKQKALSTTNIASGSETNSTEDSTSLLTKENGTQAMEKHLDDNNDAIKSQFRKPAFLNKSKVKQKKSVAQKSTPYVGGLPFPDFSGVSLKRELHKEIITLWWNDPCKVVKVEYVSTELKEKFGQKYGQVDDHLIQEAIDNLEAQGLINKTLFNPRRTKTEYFWLFLIQLIINVLAIIPEFVNGGIKTDHGLYYSYDVRLGSFLISIVFLTFYYKRYHVLKNLNQNFSFCGCGLKYCPILCCVKKDEPMKAIPDEIELERCVSPEITARQTQTSIMIDSQDKNSISEEEEKKKGQQ